MLLLAQHGKSIIKKIAPTLSADQSIAGVRVYINDRNDFTHWVKEKLPHVRVTEQSKNVFYIPISRRDLIDTLSTSSSIIFIDRADRIPQEERALGIFDFSLNKILAVQKEYESLTGDGLVVSIKEKPFDQQDIDLKNRIVINDQFDEAATVHASIMATIVAGAGNSEPSGKGAAPGAGVTTSDFLQLLPDDGNALTTLGVTVQNHSYGVGVENYYGIESNAYDKHCNDFPTIIHVFSSGNEGEQADATGTYANLAGFANLTGQFKVSKNTLAVGSSDNTGQVATRSSRGPAHDGRVKPELIAYGDAGSSEAAAVVSGIALLTQQAYSDQFGNLPEASLLKAVLINSADDCGRPEVDFETGFGIADALGAVRTIEQGHFFSGNVLEGGENNHLITIPSGIHQLKVTLTWHDVEADPTASKALVNDLDLILTHVSSGDQWKPWVLSHFPHVDSLILPAKRRVDHINNVEQITVTLPASGNYEIAVRGFSIPESAQVYHIAYEVESGFEWINPLSEMSFDAGKSNMIRWRWSDVPATGTLEYKFVEDDDWVLLSNSIEMRDQYFQWITPDTTARVQLRLTANSTAFASAIFSIAKPIVLKVGYACSEEVMLVWNRVPSAEQYQVYTLGDTYLEPFMTTADTFAILNKVQKKIVHYSVAPVLQNVEAVKGLTIDYTLQGTGCYYISFLPREYVVDDEAVFDLRIGTTYKLEIAALQRLTGEVFEDVQQISPLTATELVFTDPNPVPGINVYRVKLIDDSQIEIFSETEQLFYTRKNDLFVFPNPILSGELVNIVVDDQNAVQLRLYDMMGRIHREIMDEAIVKTLDTSSLPGGAYVVEVIKPNGQRLTTRLIIY